MPGCGIFCAMVLWATSEDPLLLSGGDVRQLGVSHSMPIKRRCHMFVDTFWRGFQVRLKHFWPPSESETFVILRLNVCCFVVYKERAWSRIRYKLPEFVLLNLLSASLAIFRWESYSLLLSIEVDNPLVVHNKPASYKCVQHGLPTRTTSKAYKVSEQTAEEITFFIASQCEVRVKLRFFRNVIFLLYDRRAV
jgi:hypothetical protein